MENKNFSRRKFINTVGLSAFAAGTLALPAFSYARPVVEADRNINHIGPMEGYTPQIGTLVSMLEWISDSVIRVTKKLSVEELDYIHDKDSNSIGALMMHVAATEVIYQDLTFKNLNNFSAENKTKWGIAMDLGPDAQTKIKGNNVTYYTDAMNEARSKSLAEFKKRDDAWLLSGETKEWSMNNYCKWFHVTEHFANHRGQITWYSKRLPVKGS
jgi:uncharacterized damage-inducible protein DinB